jgi:hypothetical protein
MSLAQYASPYNNDDSGETDNINANIRMTQSQGQNRGGGGKKNPSSSTFRKTIKRPLMQQQQQQQQKQEQNVGSSQSQSRVANFMSKLSAVKGMGMNTNYLQGDDGTSGMDESETDLADYQPMNQDSGGNQIRNQNQNQTNGGDENNDDGVVTRESFENLPSTYASQYYQQYVPLSYNQQLLKSSNQGDYASGSGSSGSRDDLIEKMNHIIQMLEDQQDEKTGSVTEELILYCFLGVFVIFVVDSFVRAGKYVR